MDGLSTLWYENGHKGRESSWKGGKLMSAKGWKPTGEKCPVTNVKGINGVLVRYNDEGTEDVRFTYKDGVRVK
jgi:antitoxin component YwqK of YwqJK toxin-antitoxin module